MLQFGGKPKKTSWGGVLPLSYYIFEFAYFKNY